MLAPVQISSLKNWFHAVDLARHFLEHLTNYAMRLRRGHAPYFERLGKLPKEAMEYGVQFNVCGLCP